MEQEYEILNSIKSVGDVKNLNIYQLERLAREIRHFLVTSVSKTGGHLSSNLGVVELTIALHYVYNLPEDKIVWDVGHQSYVHKLLTGRKEDFKNLRQFGGMSGFPKTTESPYDVFNTGHSSTSISASLGIARARDLKKEKYEVCAVIGDGAMTGGMAFEALNDAAHDNTKMLVILNDNAMSISPNVGGLSSYLRNLRITTKYRNLANKTERFLSKIVFGPTLIRAIKKTKRAVKSFFLQDSFFEQLGLKYYGPIDGHDITRLVEVLKEIKKINAPVLLHIHTQKGKGYVNAEANPGKFHGVAAFNIESGNVISGGGESYSSVFGSKLVDLAEANENVVAVTAAMEVGTGLSSFAAKFPQRFFDVGIAEQHAVTFAAGLAINGIVPVVALYSTFLQRAYDQILHDVALQNLHVVFAIDRAGVVGEDGETHQGIYDLSFLNTIPNLLILAPSDYTEFKQMLDFAVNSYNGPVAIRYPRGKGMEELYPHTAFDFTKSEKVVDGDNCTIIAVGKMVEMAVEISDNLRSSGITCDVINCRCTKPLDIDTILESVNKTGLLVVLEDNVIVGGLNSVISQKLAFKCNRSIKFIQCAYPDKPIEHGSVKQISQKYGMDVKTISKRIIDLMGE